MSGSLGKGGVGAGGGGSTKPNFRSVLHKNAASLWSRGGGGGGGGGGGDGGAASTSTQDIARRAVEREYLQMQRRGGGGKQNKKKKRGRDNDDYYSTDDDVDDHRAARQQRTKQPKKKETATSTNDEPNGAGSSTTNNNKKYRDRAKERREGKVVMVDVDDDFESDGDGDGDYGSVDDDDNDSDSGSESDIHDHDGTAGAASLLHSRRPSVPVWAQTKEQALNEVLPTLAPPSTALGKEVLRWLQRHYASTANRNGGVDPSALASPTRAGRALPQSVLKFDANLSCCDPRDAATSWQVPIEMTSATDRGDAFGRPLLNRNMIRQIDRALQRQFLQGVTASTTAALAAASAPASSRHGTTTRGKVGTTEGGPAPSHASAQSTQGNVVLEGDEDDGSAHDTRKANNENDVDDDDDDIFGDVGEYNPDGSDDDEVDDDDKEEAKKKKDKAEDEEHKSAPSGASVAHFDTASIIKPQVHRTRKLFGDVLGSVPVTTAVAAAVAVGRPDSKRHDVDSKVHGDEDDAADFDGDPSPVVGGRRRLAGLSEAVDVGYGDAHMDADFTGQFDDDDGDDNDGYKEGKDNDKTGVKKKKRRGRKKKAGGSDSE